MVWRVLNFHISTLKSHHSNSLPNSHISNSKFFQNLLEICLDGNSQQYFNSKTQLWSKFVGPTKIIAQQNAQNGYCEYPRRLSLSTSLNKTIWLSSISPFSKSCCMATWKKFLYMIMGFLKSKSNRKSNNKKGKKNGNYRENQIRLLGVRNLEIIESSKKFSPNPLWKCLHSWVYCEMWDPKMQDPLQISQHTRTWKRRDRNFRVCKTQIGSSVIGVVLHF